MGKGKRYNGAEHKLNIKKVIAVIIAFLVIIMFGIILVKLINPKKEIAEKNILPAYYTIYDNEKWGVINQNGDLVIEPIFNEMILIPNKEKPLFMVTDDVNYINDIYKTKVINDKNEILFTEYEQVEVIQNYDNQNNIWYEKDCLKVKKDNKYGLINLSGKILLNIEYDSINPMIGVKNSLITEKEGKKGLVTTSGSIIIKNEYKEIKSLTNEYENGYIVKNEEGKYGVIGTNKKALLPIEYDDIKNVYSENTYVAKQNGQWEIVNNDNNTSIKLEYEDVASINNNNIVVKKTGKYGIILLTGEEKIPVQYEELKNIYQDYYIAKKDDLYGVIDDNNNIKIDFKYKKLTYIKDADIIEGESDKIETDLFDRNFNLKLSGIVSELNVPIGYMKVRIDSAYKYYNFKFEEKNNREILTKNTMFLDKKNGKYGYVNKENIVIVDYIYDDATEQNDSGYAAVKKEGTWGAINSKGEIVVEPKYTLENCPVIDFIGEWHLAEDLNANYYIK